MLSILSDGCDRLLHQYDDVWLLAGLAERSFEEGARNAKFREAVESYEEAGASEKLLTKLRDGVNGNLKNELQRHANVEGSVVRNMGRGQDLHFTSRHSGACARVEVKVVYDLIMPKHYAVVAADFAKLQDLRGTGCNDELYQAVFFLQLPQLDYPAGTWYGRWCGCRSSYPGYRGISQQYSVLKTHLTAIPVWPPLHPPATREIGDEAIRSLFPLISHWSAQTFKPDTPWELTREHLRDAAIGCGIWRV